MKPDLLAATEPVADTRRSPGRTGLLAVLKQTTFRSLRHRNYRLYFYGQIVSFTGSWMQTAAIMWLMFDRTGDPRWPSWLLVAQVGPTLLLGTWGGHLADRVPKRQLVFATQAAFLVNAMLLTLFVATGRAGPAVVLALQVVSGVVHAIDLPARLAFVPDLVPKEDLFNAVGLNALVFNAARAVGPSVAGGVVSRRRRTRAGSLRRGEPGHPRGGRVLRAQRPQLSGRALCASGASRSRTSQARRRTARGGRRSTASATCVRGRHSAGWSVSHWSCAFSAGRCWRLLACIHSADSRAGRNVVQPAGQFFWGRALLAAVAAATFGTIGRRSAFLVLGAAATAAGLLGLAWAGTRPVAAGCCGCVGFGLILFLSTGQSALQLAVPDEMRGRVMAIWAITLSGSTPLGHLLAGEGVRAIGVERVFMAMAAGTGFVAAGLAVLVAGRGLGNSGDAQKELR